MLNSISKAIISSAIIFTPFLATSQAADENIYDASSCVTTHGTATLNSIGALINNSTTTNLSIRCPIQRDRNHRSLDSDHSYVLVRDHTNENSVRCSLRQNLVGRNNEIELEYVTAETDRVSSSSEYKRLTFPSRTFTNTDEGSFYLWCHLPTRQLPNAGSAISGFRIDED